MGAAVVVVALVPVFSSLSLDADTSTPRALHHQTKDPAFDEADHRDAKISIEPGHPSTQDNITWLSGLINRKIRLNFTWLLACSDFQVFDYPKPFRGDAILMFLK